MHPFGIPSAHLQDSVAVIINHHLVKRACFASLFRLIAHSHTAIQPYRVIGGYEDKGDGGEEEVAYEMSQSLRATTERVPFIPC
jgi:hypothetical protein